MIVINELPHHKNTWRNLKCMLLSEISEAVKNVHCMITIVWHSGKGKAVQIIQSVVARSWGGENRDEQVE